MTITVLSTRARSVAAATAVLAFFGVATLAPLSASQASSDLGRAMILDQTGRQGISTGSADPSLDLSTAAAEEGKISATPALITLEQFMFRGSVNWGGYRFTYYSQQVLPGGGLNIPGRHVNEGGYISDADGYIVLAGSAPKGTVYDTPFGYQGKIYDRGTVGNHLDVYIR